MKNIMKYIIACLFYLAFLITAKAQDENTTNPGPEDIVCVQVAENVFDCYVREDSKEGGIKDMSKGQRLNEEYRLNEEDKNLMEGEEEKLNEPSVKENDKEENSSEQMDGNIKEEIPEIKVQCFNP